jgi:RNA polymerase sigma factor (sigma-70 family)
MPAIPPGASVTPPPRDDAWFEALFTTHTTAVYRYFRRRLPAGSGGAGPDTEDLTAEVFATAWRRREDVPEGAELPWLYRTAGFVLANHRRKMRPVLVADVPEEADDVDPQSLALTDDHVRRVLGVLTPRDRRILLLNAWDGLTGDQLAHVLGVSRGGADAALSRARARLRDAWAAQSRAGDTGEIPVAQAPARAATPALRPVQESDR